MRLKQIADRYEKRNLNNTRWREFISAASDDIGTLLHILRATKQYVDKLPCTCIKGTGYWHKCDRCMAIMWLEDL